MSAGGGNIGPNKRVWTLTDLDFDIEIVGQYIAQSVSRSITANIGESAVYNADESIEQFVHGNSDTIDFEGRFHSSDFTDFSVEDRLDALEGLIRRNDDLGRPPVCLLTIGDIPSLTKQVLVTAIGPISYNEPDLSGRNQGATFTISLIAYQELEYEATDPTVPQSFTRIRRARKGDTYESIAQDEYGNAEFGILLRQLNPRLPGMDLTELRQGDPVHIYPDYYLTTLPIVPEYHGFKTGVGNEAAEERLKDLFEARSSTKYSTIYSG